MEWNGARKHACGAGSERAQVNGEPGLGWKVLVVLWGQRPLLIYIAVKKGPDTLCRQSVPFWGRVDHSRKECHRRIDIGGRRQLCDPRQTTAPLLTMCSRMGVEGSGRAGCASPVL
ncbi:hypothetical protein HRbin28_01772 [bacterium HR28]|nr:hypothetical protein HRbin28_01772 [bacterium HR28]